MAKETDILLNGGITLVAKSFSEERPGLSRMDFVPGCVNRCACAVTAQPERESGAEGGGRLLSHDLRIPLWCG